MGKGKKKKKVLCVNILIIVKNYVKIITLTPYINYKPLQHSDLVMYFMINCCMLKVFLKSYKNITVTIIKKKKKDATV